MVDNVHSSLSELDKVRKVMIEHEPDVGKGMHLASELDKAIVTLEESMTFFQMSMKDLSLWKDDFLNQNSVPVKLKSSFLLMYSRLFQR